MVICDCGSIAIIRTSWTSTNPGRRFYCCSIKVSCLMNWHHMVCVCIFLGWVDGPMCPRAVQIIPGLLRSKNEVEAALKITANQARNGSLCVLLAGWHLLCIFVGVGVRAINITIYKCPIEVAHVHIYINSILNDVTFINHSRINFIFLSIYFIFHSWFNFRSIINFIIHTIINFIFHTPSLIIHAPSRLFIHAPVSLIIHAPNLIIHAPSRLIKIIIKVDTKERIKFIHYGLRCRGFFIRIQLLNRLEMNLVPQKKEGMRGTVKDGMVLTISPFEKKSERRRILQCWFPLRELHVLIPFADRSRTELHRSLYSPQHQSFLQLVLDQIQGLDQFALPLSALVRRHVVL
ncbi:hypothetical protein OSB04_028619 [Centaurea solstitialis]|uniref:GRF-type domain-containing protein n=1 Tax=Centaurea solstitialis TaxID=347529 RepID=A0AA38SGU6_9ASTR|nr:hypothetical protein OSB04_028619 [Centaurea solstitialis]